MANRYKGNPIGNASNALVRNILSNLGNERFNSADWTETKKYSKIAVLIVEKSKIQKTWLWSMLFQLIRRC